MHLGIAGRVALVTAASRGLGRAAALALSQEGAKVVVCARGEAALAEAEAAIVATGGEVLAIPADVTDPATPSRLVDATLERFGAVDILVANAGGPPPGRAFDVDDEAIMAAINANMLTSIRLVRAATPPMRHAGWGRICMITSAAIKQASPALVLSGTARTGLWAWAKAAAIDLFPEGITVNLVCPGLHATERLLELGGGSTLEPGKLGDPADFGKVVAFLCSDPARFISGVALNVDGGAVSGLA